MSTVNDTSQVTINGKKPTHYTIVVEYEDSVYVSTPFAYDAEKFKEISELFNNGVGNLSIAVSESKIQFFSEYILSRSIISLELHVNEE